MGIPGLTSFLDANPHLLTDHCLSDTGIVIDGNNLFHFLYHWYHIPSQFGGDYDLFANSVRSFFGVLLKCDIKPIVLFDGPYDPEDKKIQTATKRARERIQLAFNLVSGQNTRVTPILAQDVFVSVLNELGVDHVTCDAEADLEIASLANILQYPVMTNDSDFFIFDIKAGVVLLDYINLHVKTQKITLCNCINVQMFHFNNLHGLFPGMDKDLIPLFATIIGNDRVDNKTFEPFFAGVKLAHSSEKLYCKQGKHRLTGLLLWLENVQTLAAAMEKILVHYKHDSRPAMKKLIMESIKMYQCESVSIAYNYLRRKQDQATNRSSPNQIHSATIGADSESNKSGVIYNNEHRQLTANDETCPEKVDQGLNDTCKLMSHIFPSWFVEDIRLGHVSSLVVNAAISQQVILLCQPECMAKPSSHLCSRGLRRTIYGILVQNPLSSANTTVTKKNITFRHGNCVEEIDRDIKNQQRTLIERQDELDGKVLPNLTGVLGLCTMDRLDILCGSLGVRGQELQVFPSNIQLYMATVIYWINQSRPKVDHLYLAAIILCVIKLNALKGSAEAKVGEQATAGEQAKAGQQAKAGKQATAGGQAVAGKQAKAGSKDDQTCLKDELPSATEPRDGEADSKCGTEVKLYATTQLEKFCQLPKQQPQKKSSTVFDVLVIHTLSQLQSCMLASQSLNQLLMAPLKKVQVSSVFSGTFLYNVYKDLRSRPKPEEYIREVLGRCPILNGLYQHLKDSVIRLCEDNCLVMDVMAAGKKGKKKSKKSGRHSYSDAGDAETSERVDTQSGAAESVVVANCDLNNKFGSLLLDPSEY